jgi:hypothetical protein
MLDLRAARINNIILNYNELLPIFDIVIDLSGEPNRH